MAVLRLKLVVFFFLCSSLYSVAQSNYPVLLPKPQQVKWYAETTACSGVEISKAENQEYIHHCLSDLGIVAQELASTKLEITMVDQIEEARVNQHEAYRLRINDHYIHIEAITEQGVYWAFQTLRQLMVHDKDQLVVQNCEIIDWPAFRIRGFMHDVGRGFIPVDELKKQIALLSQFKINVFHWHLTEDIGWRLESKV
ncbi:MAG: family 20 glycosylhydrolase, partial [Marinilabiliaceae bacterium]|nr:family 20 glycosylhydrolase [Marinilabiliaceae bacterium]